MKFPVINAIVNIRTGIVKSDIPERGKIMKNADIREIAKKKGVCLWEISEYLGYSHETAFSRILRHELSDEKKKKIIFAINDISSRRI